MLLMLPCDAVSFVPFGMGGRVLPCFHAFTEEGANAMAATGKDGWEGVIKGKPKFGDWIERRRTTRLEDIHASAEMTGDRNPMHHDGALARKTPIGKLIVQGGVTTGMLSACVAGDLPGPGTVFLNSSLNFLTAAGVGEELTSRFAVETVSVDKPNCNHMAGISDSAGGACVEGEAMTHTMALEGP